MAIVFELKEFSGPLELLLHLIGSAKIDIKDVFVSQVTDQYIRIVQDADMIDMDEASEFIQMAATLLLIKSRSILPRVPADTDEGDDDPEQTLIRQLEEYARFQQLAAQMQGFEQAAARLFTKLPDEFPLPPPVYELEGLTMEGLIAAYFRLAKRLRAQDGDLVAPRSVIRLDQHTVANCMGDIMRKTRHGRLAFSELLSDAPTRNEVVSMFLALLELLKQGRIKAVQETAGADIMLMRCKREGQSHAE